MMISQPQNEPVCIKPVFFLLWIGILLRKVIYLLQKSLIMWMALCLSFAMYYFLIREICWFFSNFSLLLSRNSSWLNCQSLSYQTCTFLELIQQSRSICFHWACGAQKASTPLFCSMLSSQFQGSGDCAI